MTKTEFFMGASLALCATVVSLPAQAKLYKWVDERGETHYGEVIPPEYADRERIQFDKKGRVVKKEKAAEKHKTIEESRAEIEQRRHDKALLNTYANEDEIDLALKRNLQQVEARIQGIHMLQKSAQESLNGFHKEASELPPGKPMPPSLKTDIKAAENRLEKLKTELKDAKEKEASVRAAFEADKQRYRELTGKDAP